MTQKQKKFVAISLAKRPAEAEQTKYLLAAAAAAAYTTAELMMKEFVSADGPISLCTLHTHTHSTSYIGCEQCLGAMSKRT